MLQGESEEVWINTAIYSHALLRMHVIGVQRSVWIALPFLPPHHSGPATRDFQSSISVEMLLSGCHLDVQCMHPSPIPPVLCHGPPLWSPPSGQWVVVSHVYICSTTANFYVIPFRHRHPGFPSVLSSVSIWSPQCRPRWPQLQGIQYRYTTLDYISSTLTSAWCFL